MNHEVFMQQALAQAKKASAEGEIPVGALLVLPSGETIAAHNTRESSRNPLLHAEMSLLPQAAQILNNWRLNECTLYVTLEPCPMCLGALLQARIHTLVFGAYDPQRENLDLKVQTDEISWPSLKNFRRIKGNNHQMEVVGGVLQEECAQVLKEFFQDKRQR